MKDYPACPCGSKMYHRQRVGPTGAAGWMILVNKCGCGCQEAVYPDKMTYHQKRWIERWNIRCMRENYKPLPRPRVSSDTSSNGVFQ